MPKLYGIFIFVIVGFIMFSVMTYLAFAYGLLGLFSKVLCVGVLAIALTCVLARS